MIKVALIGIGGMGFVHYGAYKKVENAQVIAVADVRVDMAREKVDDENIKIYSSLEEVLENENPDVIDICTPSYMHRDMAITALSAGKHVLCEKPMSLSTEDTAKIIEAAEKSGKLFMTAHVVRFMAPYVYLKNVIDSGELGKPVHFELRRLSEIPIWSWENWMMDTKKSGGCPIDLSIHDLDFIQYAFGMPKAVSGMYKKMENNNDHITSNLVYDGFTVTVTSGWFSYKYPFKAEFTAIFENGAVELANGVLTKNGETIDLEKGETSDDTGINLSGADGYADEIAYFIDCIINNKKPEKVTPESSQNSVKLVEKILENAIIL